MRGYFTSKLFSNVKKEVVEKRFVKLPGFRFVEKFLDPSQQSQLLGDLQKLRSAAAVAGKTKKETCIPQPTKGQIIVGFD
jgi:hypothetical protein